MKRISQKPQIFWASIYVLTKKRMIFPLTSGDEPSCVLANGYAGGMLASRSVRQQGRWELGRHRPDDVAPPPPFAPCAPVQTSSSALRPGY